MGRKSRIKRNFKRLEEMREADRLELLEVKSVIPGTRQFFMGECEIFLAKQQVGSDKPVMHISIKCKSRYPTWDEVMRVRFSLLSADMDVAHFLPKKDQYQNIKDNCFHLWQVNFVTTDPEPDQKEG